MSYLIEGKSGHWEVIIGLEVHAQILSKSKLFSGASTLFGAEPNANVSFIDAAFPGVLPRLNKFCVKQAVKTGLVLNGSINKVSCFDRKHYFYPDLPSGYQITQFYKPIMEEGYLNINLDEGVTKKVRVERLHIEQDAGKLLHDHHNTKSFVDLNRAGVGLMEIVSYPDIRSKEEAAAYVSTLRSLLRYIGTCDGNMEEGSLRCDVNISVKKPEEKEFRTRVEIKNVNSVKFLQQAIDYEVGLHIETWENGGTVVQETKLFNPSLGKTYSLRTKENTGDYRYIRDPDILPILISEDYISEIKQSLPELPQEKRNRYVKQGLNSYEADILSSTKEFAEYFDSVLSFNVNPKLASNWIITNLFALLNKEGLEITNSKITPEHLAQLVNLIDSGTISGKIGKDIFETMWDSGRYPKDIVAQLGLEQISDVATLESLIDDLIKNNPDKVSQIKEGKDRLIGWFVGCIMKETQGKANPTVVNELLNKKLGRN